MPLSAQLPPDEPLNMTPMIDVVFNLLIFFMLSASFITEERELELSVPTVKSSAPMASAPRDLVINIERSGDVVVDGQKFDAAGLEAFLEKARSNYPDQTVSIRGDQDARHQWFAEVLAICKRAKIRSIDVIVQEGG